MASSNLLRQAQEETPLNGAESKASKYSGIAEKPGAYFVTFYKLVRHLMRFKHVNCSRFITNAIYSYLYRIWSTPYIYFYEFLGHCSRLRTTGDDFELDYFYFEFFPNQIWA